MGFTLGRGHPFPAGTTVTAYEDIGQKPSGVPNGLVAIDTAVVAADLAQTLFFDDLAASKRYYAVAQVAGVWRWVSFQTVSDAITTTDLAAHEADTTNIHGVADTGSLRTTSQESTAIAAHSADTSDVHGVADMTKAQVRNEAPLRLSDYSAVDSAPTLAEVNSFLAAVSTALGTGRGVVGPLDAAMNGELVVPGSAPFLVEGMSPDESRFRWPTDLGANKVPIKFTGSEPSEHLYREFRDVGFVGPGQGAGFALTSNVQMGGVHAAARTRWRNVRGSGFHSGAVFGGFGSVGATTAADHVAMYDCRFPGNLFSLYLGSPMTTWGDLLLSDCSLSDTRLASIGIGGQSKMVGTRMLGGHMGFGPVGIFMEDGTTFDNGRINGCLFAGVSLEAIGNAWIMDYSYVNGGFSTSVGDANKLEDTTFIGFEGTGYPDAGYDIPALSGDASYMVENIVGCTWIDCPPAYGASHAVRARAIGRSDFGDIGALVDANGNTKRYFNVSGDIEAICKHNTLRARPHKVAAGVASVVKGDVLQIWGGGGDQAAAQQGQGGTYSFPYGVALESGAAGTVVLGVEEGVRSVKSGANAISAGNPVIVDPAGVAQIKAGALTDARLVGAARGGSSGGFTPVELRLT